MNWYKIAKDFSDRNTINAKIKYLNEVRGSLAHIRKLIFQSGTVAKQVNYKIVSSSKITSYPTLHEILIQADDLALDSPWRFASLCEEGIGKIDQLIDGLNKERKEITYGEGNKYRKGWFLDE